METEIKNKLWQFLISVDYDYSRIIIAEHEIDKSSLNLWLEDKHDFKNTLDDCLQIEIPINQFSKLIKSENLNSYEGVKIHPVKNFAYKARIEINKPITWYNEDASLVEQQWAREAVLKEILTSILKEKVHEI